MEAYADGEIGYPIDEHGDGHSRRPGTLAEELGCDHPWYGARADSEKHHEPKNGHDCQVRHPVDHFLHKTEKLLRDASDQFNVPYQNS